MTKPAGSGRKRPPTRILLVRNADRRNYGGAETFLLHLASELKKQGLEPILATSNPRLFERSKAAGLTTTGAWWLSWQRWHGPYTLLLPLHCFWMLLLTTRYLYLIRKLKIDVLAPQNRDDWIAATAAGKLLGRPIIWSDHADLKHEVANVRIWYKNWLGRVVLFWARRSTAITVVSKAEQEAVETAAGNRLRSRLKIVHNGTYASRPKPVKHPDEAFIFGITTRLRNQKGLRELISAFKQLPPDKRLRLWLVGDGPDEKALRELAADDERIEFLGYQEEQLRYVAAFDAFVFPSYTEGFSLSLLEAAMMGLPIIASDVGGNPEIIENNKTGLLIPSKDEAALKAAMLQLLKDRRLRERLGAAAQKRFENEFEFSKIVASQYRPLVEVTQEADR